jgi:hypothetical protein
MSILRLTMFLNNDGSIMVVGSTTVCSISLKDGACHAA